MSKVYLNIILTLLFAAVIFMGIAVVNSNDRLYFSNQKILRKIDELKSKNFNVGTNFEGKLPVIAQAGIANAEFFDSEAQFGGRLIRTISADTQNLNYLINNDSYAMDFYALCSSALAERNYQNIEEFQSALAESWEISPDNKVYTIKLRKNVFWQSYVDPVTNQAVSPQEVTSSDFKFLVDVVKNEDVNCAPLRVYYKDLDELEVVDKYTFKVKWSKANYGSLGVTLGMMPLPRHFYLPSGGEFNGKVFNEDHLRNRMIVGCGAYKFSGWEKDVRINFVANENYWGKPYGIAPPLKNLSFELIKHPGTRFQALLSGAVDQLGLTPEQWSNRTDNADFERAQLRKYRYLSTAYFYIGYNLKNPLFQNRDVRVALTHLVDREKIIRDVYRNEAEITTGPFFRNSPYYDKSIEPYPYDIEAARKLLKRAGWEDRDGDGILENSRGEKFKFSILAIASHPIQEKMLPIIKESMAKCGVEMSIQNVEWSVYLQRLQNRSFEVCTLGWTVGVESDQYQLWHSSQADLPGSSNHISFKNKRADQLIEELRITFDMKKRIELSHEFHRLIHDEQPYTFLFAPYSLNAVSKRYQNFREFPLGCPSEIWWTPQNEQRRVSGFQSN